MLFISCVAMLSHLFIASLWSPENDLFALICDVYVILLLSHLISLDRCGT